MIQKKLEKLVKKGASILAVLTKTEADLEAQIEEAKKLDEEITAEILEKEMQSQDLGKEIVEYSAVLTDIKALLGKEPQ